LRTLRADFRVRSLRKQVDGSDRGGRSSSNHLRGGLFLSLCLRLTHSHSLTYVVSPSTPALAIASVKPVVEDNAIHFHVLDRTPLPVPPTRPPITLARYRSCGSVQPSATLISQSLCMCVCVYVCVLCSFQPGGMLVRGHHQYTTQGWAELLGYYVERVLGM
jgi:hypothetical protein